MTRPSALLSSQVDPAALQYLAHEIIKAVGESQAVKIADKFNTAALAMERGGANGKAERQTAGAIMEAIEIAHSVERDKQKEKAAA